MASGYYIKWVEDVVLRDDKASSVAKFIYRNNRTRFGCPIELVSNQGGHFLIKVIKNLTSLNLLFIKIL